jgi:hypothetical protein
MDINHFVEESACSACLCAQKKRSCHRHQQTTGEEK